MSFRAPNAGRFCRTGVTHLHNAGVVASTAFFGTSAVKKLVPATTLALTTQGLTVNVLMVPAATLTLTPVAPSFPIVFVPAATLALSEQAPGAQLRFTAAAESFSLSEQAPTYATLRQVSVPAAALSLTAKQPQIIYNPPVSGQSRAIYRLYLAADGYDDLELPLSSFSANRRNGEPTYLYVVIPSPVPYISAITDRVGGEIVLHSGFATPDTEAMTELMRVDFDSFRYDLGARSGSASLTGHSTVSFSNPKTILLQGVSYKNVTDGIRRVRCYPDMWLAPGDTADLGGGETFVVDFISYTISPNQATMEVSEVEA